MRKYNKDHPECKLNTSHLKLEGASKPIFIAETLTTKGNRLFFLARDFAKANKYIYCWTSYGKVYLRKIEGSPLIRINEDADLIELRDNSIWLASCYKTNLYTLHKTHQSQITHNQSYFINLSHKNENLHYLQLVYQLGYCVLPPSIKFICHHVIYHFCPCQASIRLELTL